MSKPSHDTKNFIATLNCQTMSRHQKVCRDTELLRPCRNTKGCVTTAFCSLRSFRVATPQQLPLSRHGKSCRDSEPACPSPAMSRHKNWCRNRRPKTPCRMQACRARTTEGLHALARAPGSAGRDTTCCVATRTRKWAVAHPASPLHIFFSFSLCSTYCKATEKKNSYFFTKATGTGKTHKITRKCINTCYLYISQIKEFNYNSFSCAKTGIIFQNSTKHNMFMFKNWHDCPEKYFFFTYFWTIMSIIPQTPKVIFSQPYCSTFSYMLFTKHTITQHTQHIITQQLLECTMNA